MRFFLLAIWRNWVIDQRFNSSFQAVVSAVLLGSACLVSLGIGNFHQPIDQDSQQSDPQKVKIRFAEQKSGPSERLNSQQVAPAKAPAKSAQQEPAPLKQVPSKNPDGKLADVGRATVPLISNLGQSDLVSVATEEERNQKIAVDWKDPSVVFFITGKQYGYMEPCGCTGLENQKGGLSRRDSLLTSVRQRGWDVVPIDGGNQVRRRGRQSEIKYDWTAIALDAMEYQMTTFGEDDLQLDIGSLLLPMTGANGKSGLFVSANVSIDSNFDVRYKTLMVKNRKIGITAFLGDESAKKVDSSDIKITSPVSALKKVFAEMKNDKCDYFVLVAQASLDESRAVVLQVPGFNLLVSSGGYGEPTFRPEQIDGTQTQMVQMGIKGMYVGLFGLFDDPDQPFRYQRIALSSQFADSPRITELFGKYQDQLKAVSYDGLGLRPVSHPTSREFVGSEKCGECHTTAFEIWKNTPHAHATDSIVEPPERTMARHFDPECLSCHVTGWNPQKFHPYRTGYESLTATPMLVANGCENCHGPGAKHSAAESGEFQADKEMTDLLRNEMKLPMEKARDKCLECHDIDNSPDFHKDSAFEEYWDKVKHYGKD
jgi:hypothetical protein